MPLKQATSAPGQASLGLSTSTMALEAASLDPRSCIDGSGSSGVAPIPLHRWTRKRHRCDGPTAWVAVGAASMGRAYGSPMSKGARLQPRRGIGGALRGCIGGLREFGGNGRVRVEGASRLKPFPTMHARCVAPFGCGVRTVDCGVVA